jgi:hypothetical protein
VPAAPAPPVEAVPAEDEHKLRVFAGLMYGTLAGSEVENTDALTGIDGGISYRVLWSVSLWGSFAASYADVEGQVVQLLDVPVRADGRSGTVLAKISQSRFRIGARVDGLVEPDFNVQPYLVGALTFNTNTVDLIAVDGGAPDHPSYDDTQFGALGRLGADVRITERICIDANFYYEVFEFQPATNASAGLGAGISVRL